MSTDAERSSTMSKNNNCRNLREDRGFTLLELLVTVAIIAILAVIAVPSYSSYVSQGRAKGAASDLVSWSLVMENDFQKNLSYPVYPTTTVPATWSSRTSAEQNDFVAWVPAEGTYFNYSVTSTASSYTLTATAIAGNCTLSITSSSTQGNSRTVTGTGCGFTSW